MTHNMLSTILTLLLSAQLAISLDPISLDSRDSSSGSSNPVVSKALHILPLGASITYGLHSSTGNGYREDLRTLLQPTNVTFVGSQCSGNMTNPNSEGHPGYQISQMQAVAAPDIQYNPNIVLVYVGTNDMIGDAPVSEASSDMVALINYLKTNLPDSLIVVSNLFDSAKPRVQQRIDAFNSRLYKLQLPSNVMIANISEQLTHADFYTDGIHPNDNGYQKMAQFFYQVTVTAYTAGNIPDRQSYQANEIRCDNQSSTDQPASPTSSSAVSASTTVATTGQSSSTSVSGSSRVGQVTGFWWYCNLLLAIWCLV